MLVNFSVIIILNSSSGGGKKPMMYRAKLHTYQIQKGYTVVQLVGALCYKPAGRGLDSRWCHWNFSLT